MLLNKWAFHPNAVRIDVRGPDEREYYVDGVRIWGASVSTAIKPFFPLFDSKKISANLRPDHKDGKDENGVVRTPKQIRRVWKINRDISAKFGTDRHKDAENILSGIPIPEENKPLMVNFMFWLEEVKPKDWELVWVEQALWCPHTHDNKITPGRGDSLWRKKSNGKYIYVDWKFQKESEHQFQKGKSTLYCSCGAWKLGPVESVDHESKCAVWGPVRETKHIFMNKWAPDAAKCSLYSEMMRRNFDADVEESYLVYPHHLSPLRVYKIDFDKFTLVVDAVLGKK